MPGVTSCPESAQFYIDPATGLKHSCKRFCNTYPDYCTFSCPDYKNCYRGKVTTTTPGLTFPGSTSKTNIVAVGNVSPYIYIGVPVAGLAFLVIILWIAINIYLCKSKDSSNRLTQCCCATKTDNVSPASKGNQERVRLETMSGVRTTQCRPSDPEETERLLDGKGQSIVSTTTSQNAAAASLSGNQPVPSISSTSRAQCTKHSTTGSLGPDSAQSNNKKSRHKSAPPARVPNKRLRSNGAVSSARSTGYHSQMPVQQVDTSGAVYMLPSGSAEPFLLSSCQLQQLLSDASGYYVHGNHDNHSLPDQTQPLSLQSGPPLSL